MPSDIKVLYEDNHIIAVLKPAGLLTQGDGSGDVSLFDQVKDYIRIKKGKFLQENACPAKPWRSGVFLGLVHRLDKPVSGIVLFAKTSKGASRLSEQFRNHTIQKTYHGIIIGKLSENKGVIKDKVNKISFFAEGFGNKTDEELLAEIKKATKTRIAELSWEVVRFNDKYSLLKIMPKTGRFHQIRVQMAEMGHPILGDRKYGLQPHRPIREGEWVDSKSIALCATATSFKSATGEKQIDLSIPLPESWKKYL